MTVVNPNFFSSTHTGYKISDGYQLSRILPRMITREDFLEVFDEA